jgi:hypothetical protein
MWAGGFQPPAGLVVAELAGLSLIALVCGFTASLAMLRALLPWLRLRSVRGTVLVCLGVVSVYVPPQFLYAAVFLTLGIRLVWAEACDLADAEKRRQFADHAGEYSPPPAGSLIRTTPRSGMESAVNRPLPGSSRNAYLPVRQGKE